MSGEVRLHAPTLEWAQGRCEEQARDDEGWALTALGGVDRNTEFFRGRARGYRKAADCFGAMAAEARSRPPAFSDWIRATEGTALGEPEWDEHEAGCAMWRRNGETALLVVLRGQPVKWAEVVLYGKLNGHDPLTTPDIHCTTPAELRAALEALARA